VYHRPVTLEGQVPAPSAVGSGVDDSKLIRRDAATAVIYGAYAATREGQGAPVLVTADAGGGKTMLVRHFLDWAGALDARVLSARFFDYSGSRLARRVPDTMMTHSSSALSRC
jgi:hypothetical protein